MKAEYGEDLAEGEESGESSVGGSWLVTRCTASENSIMGRYLFSFLLDYGLVQPSAFCLRTQELHQLDLLIFEAYIMAPQSIS